MKQKITFISDTHGKHKMLTKDLIGGDILIHSGDIMTDGYHKEELIDFLNWFEGINNYGTKIFIAGNHDRTIQDEPEWFKGILTNYKTIDYLQDEEMVEYYDGHNGDFIEENIRFYGSPWQPWFYNWAFNLPRNGEELERVWNQIPTNTDILITHSPPFGILDKPYGHGLSVGCELLRSVIDNIKPKIMVYGHIHGSHGYYFNGNTHFINASVLNERYMYSNLPLNIEWDSITNEITWLNE